HVLHFIQGIEEPLISAIDCLSPCGFCGQSQLAHPKCALKLKVTSSHGSEFLTDCPIQAQIKFGYADKGSQKQLCQNIPLWCPLCPLPPHLKVTDWRPRVWRYNMEQHLNFHHPEYTHPGKLIGVPLPSSTAATVFLTPLEKVRLGVPVHPKFMLISMPTIKLPPSHLLQPWL
ncbi:hypothetical protein PAXRUDRAFT_799662, partial [Paxillus rubicundulus Ve08.2h10]